MMLTDGGWVKDVLVLSLSLQKKGILQKQYYSEKNFL